MLIFCDFIQVYVFSTNHHLKEEKSFKGFSIFSSGAILFNGVEWFEQFW